MWVCEITKKFLSDCWEIPCLEVETPAHVILIRTSFVEGGWRWGGRERGRQWQWRGRGKRWRTPILPTQTGSCFIFFAGARCQWRPWLNIITHILLNKIIFWGFSLPKPQMYLILISLKMNSKTSFIWTNIFSFLFQSCIWKGFWSSNVNEGLTREVGIEIWSPLCVGESRQLGRCWKNDDKFRTRGQELCLSLPCPTHGSDDLGGGIQAVSDHDRIRTVQTPAKHHRPLLFFLLIIHHNIHPYRIVKQSASKKSRESGKIFFLSKIFFKERFDSSRHVHGY